MSNPTKSNMSDFIGQFHARYGQATYGLVVLLIVWTQILRPIYLDSKADAKILATVADTLNQAAMANAQAAVALNQTAKSLERMIDDLKALK